METEKFKKAIELAEKCRAETLEKMVQQTMQCHDNGGVRYEISPSGQKVPYHFKLKIPESGEIILDTKLAKDLINDLNSFYNRLIDSEVYLNNLREWE